jgi:hypothetical protein
MSLNKLQKEDHELLQNIDKVLYIIDNINDHNLLFKVRKTCVCIRENAEQLISDKKISLIPEIQSELDSLLNSFKIFYVNGTVEPLKYEEILTIVDEIHKELK